MSDTRPIGVFDSGLGGLSVLREITRLLPQERALLYILLEVGVCVGQVSIK